MAGLHYQIFNSTTGMSVAVSGYSHKHPVLLQKLLAKIRTPAMPAERFVMQKDILARECAAHDRTSAA